MKSQALLRGWTFSSATTAISLGPNGIRILEPQPRLTYRAGFRPPGEDTRVLTIVVVGEGGQTYVDQAEIEPEPPATP